MNTPKRFLIILICLLQTHCFIKAKPPALQNTGNSCFINASLQALYNIKPLTDYLTAGPNIYLPRSIPFKYVQLIQNKTFSPKELVDFNNTVWDIFFNEKGAACSQQDASEFLIKFMDSFVNKNVQLNVPFQDAKTYKLYVAKFKKNIADMIYFQQISRLIFPETNEEKDAETQEKDCILSIAIAQNNNGISTPMSSLNDCLDNHFAKELMDDPANLVKDSAGKMRVATKQLLLDDRQLPSYLIIHLKRYDPMLQKLEHTIEVPFNLDISNFLNSSSTKTIAPYSLKAIITQIGSTIKGGHYIAQVQDDSGQWFNCNDANISPINNFEQGKQNVSTDGYVLIYQTTGSLPSIQPPPLPPPSPLYIVNEALNKLTAALHNLHKALKPKA